MADKPVVTCPNCQNTFILTRSDKVYCTRSCKQDAWEKRQQNRLYRGRDPDKKRKSALNLYYKNYQENKEKALERQKNNPKLYRYHAAKRRSAKLKRTPTWADLGEIKEFYKNCPEGFHVDHIIPLQGDNVSGLHVLENLQYLPELDNLTKGNSFAVTY